MAPSVVQEPGAYVGGKGQVQAIFCYFLSLQATGLGVEWLGLELGSHVKCQCHRLGINLMYYNTNPLSVFSTSDRSLCRFASSFSAGELAYFSIIWFNIYSCKMNFKSVSFPSHTRIISITSCQYPAFIKGFPCTGIDRLMFLKYSLPW